MPRSSRRGHLVLLDAHSLIHRAYHALPPMSTTGGQVTNAVYGFTSMLPLVLTSRPEYAIAAFDVGRPTERLATYPAYKETRKSTPDDLRPQFELCRRVLGALSIPTIGMEGHEADDVIGTLARQGEAAGLKVTIVSGDLDCLQLVSDSVEALVPRRGISDTVVYGPEQVRQRYGLEPAALIDYKALRGDTSDNVPGVPGVGEKTASQLIQRFGSVEKLLESLDEIKQPRVRANLEERREQVMVAKRLVTIRTDLDVELDLRAAAWLHYDQEAARTVFDDLEFRQLLQRLPVPDAMPHQAAIMFEPQEAGDVALIEDEGAAEELAGRLGGAGELGVYGLLEGGSARTGTLLGLGIATGEETWYVPAARLGPIRPVLESVPLQAHDVKEQELALIAHGITGPFNWRGSSYLAAYLLGAGSRDPRLEDLARDLLGMDLKSPEDTFGTGRAARKPSELPLVDLAEFAGGRARATLALRELLETEMRNLGVDYLYHEVELPLAAVLAVMEQDGVTIDVAYLGEMERELAEQLAVLEKEIHRLAGREFNINAPQQLAKLLFEELGLPVGRRTKTGYSTDADTLEALREKHPVVAEVLEHRQLQKLKSTYVDALPALVDPTTGRLHTSWNQASTATGRLSSTNPNLMNIPMRTDLGQRIRHAFRARGEDQVLLAADYSQIELRIAAHLSEDPELLSAFAAGHDIHASTAARIFKVRLEEVEPLQRRLAKVANFGSIYGQGEFGLSQQMGIPRDEAREFLREYWATYSHLERWLNGIRVKAREEGVVISATGRRRSIPDLRSPNYSLRQAAERMAINFPIQSLAADIIKIAMVRLAEELAQSGLSGRMLLQVHDELVFEIPESELPAFSEMVPRVMTGAYELQSRLEVEARYGRNWAEMQPLATAVA